MPVSLFLGMCCVSLWDALVLLRVERSFVSLVVRLCGLLFICASLCVCDVVVFMTLRKSLHIPVLVVQCSVYAGVVYLYYHSWWHYWVVLAVSRLRLIAWDSAFGDFGVMYFACQFAFF